jgi:hypothetical protein
MNSKLNIQEMAIAIAAQKNNPTILTPDFLKYSGIVPSEWELAKAPILTNSAAQVTFQNGITVIADLNRIIFAQPLSVQAQPQVVQIPAIAHKYIQTLPQVNYKGISITFRGHAPFDNQENGTREYIYRNLLNSGPWLEYGTTPVQASLRFMYNQPGVQMNLDINEALLQLAEQTSKKVVLFTANCLHPINQEDEKQGLTALAQIIDNWETDLKMYQEVVNNKFLHSLDNVIQFNL